MIERCSKQDVDSMTRAEFIAHIAEIYDVPMNIIRYEQLDVEPTDQRVGTG